VLSSILVLIAAASCGPVNLNFPSNTVNVPSNTIAPAFSAATTSDPTNTNAPPPPPSPPPYISPTNNGVDSGGGSPNGVWGDHWVK
jgi:hypothetical protein